jgi:Tol biopolymer transport system component
MTPERWKAIDQAFQAALECTPDRRDEFLANACGSDTELRGEVSSLLAAHDATPSGFLERPAVLEHALAPSPAVQDRPKRLVAAKVVIYAVAASLVIGTLVGWTLAHSPTIERWRNTFAVIQEQADARSASSIPESVGGPASGSLVVVDRWGKVIRDIPSNRPSAPRFSLDGQRIAFGAVARGRATSDVWVTSVDGGSTTRLTDDDAGSANPQWSPDGNRIAYAARVGGKMNIVSQLSAGGDMQVVASWSGTLFPSDWLRDGSALLMSQHNGTTRFDIMVQPLDGSPARAYAATAAQEIAGRISPHTHWVAYTSNESGRDEVYVDSYPRTGYRVLVSRAGGTAPVWRADGRELYYWQGDALMAVQIDGSRGDRPPVLSDERVLFRSAYERMTSTMYDVSPDGNRFVIVRRR